MTIKYPLAKPFFGGTELKYIRDCLDSGWVAHDGLYSKKFIELIKSLTSTKYAGLLSSCTGVLHATLLAIDVKAGDEILVSDFTYPATAHAIKMCGAKPIFIDVQDDTYNIDPLLIEENITENTRAIIPVHLFGNPCKMDVIMKTAKKNNLKVIEDCACALGATIDEKQVGTFGDIGAFSLHARKGITTGEGGIFVTNNASLAESINSYSRFGIINTIENGLSKCKFVRIGYNYKFSDILAAVGLAQLEKINNYIERRRVLANSYLRALADAENIILPKNSSGHVWQSFVIRIADSINRDALIRKLLKNGIQTQIGTYACHLESVYNSSQHCPISKKLFEKTITLPVYYSLDEGNINHIVKILKKCILELKC